MMIVKTSNPRTGLIAIVSIPKGMSKPYQKRSVLRPPGTRKIHANEMRPNPLFPLSSIQGNPLQKRHALAR
ncbi:MAG: hypothetical protein L3J03_00010 [Desulfobacterales bacterium]|nr:hypothetical protein [Desulfobacterales bacterium]